MGKLGHDRYILVTGGAGYIGAHMVRMLLDKGYQPVVFDNLSTGHRQLVPKEVPFIKGDLRRIADIRRVFQKYPIDAVMHFAAYIVVPESVKHPLKYYENNVGGSLNLLKAMGEARVKKIIFSSTAAVYGQPKRVPIREIDPTNPTNPYGWSKLMVEKILADVASANRDFRYISFRYFNAAGAHPSGQVGEVRKKATHLISNIIKTASGQKKYLTICGTDYPTPDGTGIRDYIHVWDICRAHLLGLKALQGKEQSKEIASEPIINLGTSRGFSVKQVIKTAEEVIGKKIPVKPGPRRPGDLARLLASSARARQLLGWQPEFSLKQIIKTAWKWECQQHRLKNTRPL